MHFLVTFYYSFMVLQWFLLQLKVLFRHVIVVSLDMEILYSVSVYHTLKDLGICRDQ